MKHTLPILMAALFSVAATGSPSIADEGFPPPGGKGDNLVHVEKRPVWASSLRNGAAAVPIRSPRASARGEKDCRVTIGKRMLCASKVPPKPSSVSLPKLKSKGRFVTRGKAIFWVEDPR